MSTLGWYIIGASLSEPHTYVESGAVAHARRTAAKMRLQHTTVVLVQ